MCILLVYIHNDLVFTSSHRFKYTSMNSLFRIFPTQAQRAAYSFSAY
jgi:hypothetical protein